MTSQILNIWVGSGEFIMTKIVGEEDTSHKYKFSVTIYDPETGKTKSFTFATSKTKTLEEALNKLKEEVRTSEEL